MCQWCRHAFSLETAVEVPFTEGRVVHCTWCDRPIRIHELMEVQTLAGQASRTKKKKDKRDLPSLASKGDQDSEPDNEEHIDDADLPTIYGSGTEDNTNDTDLASDNEGENAYQTEETGMTLIAAMATMEVIEEKYTKHRLATDLPQPNEVEGETSHGLSVSEEREYIRLATQCIEDDMRKKAKAWEDFTDDEKLIAACACPAALEEELRRQIEDANEPAVTEKACKASNAKKQNKKIATAKRNLESESSTCTTTTASISSKTSNSTASKTSSAPSIWKSGTTKGKKPSSLCVPAACILMGILYGTRMARYDLLRPVQSLATYLHEWDADCDDRLHRLISYVQSTGGKYAGSGMM